MGNGISARPIPHYKPPNRYPDRFQSSQAAFLSCKPIGFNDLEGLNGRQLFDSVFFIKDPDDPETLTSFQVTSRKDTREGIFYELLWENESRMTPIEWKDLKSLSVGGMWMGPNP